MNLLMYLFFINTRIKRIELIDEFDKNGKLEPFRELITKILDEIHDRGVQVSIRYDVDFANFEDFAPAESKRIRVSLKNVKDPLEIIWVLFREYGHFLSHPRGNGNSLPEKAFLTMCIFYIMRFL